MRKKDEKILIGFYVSLKGKYDRDMLVCLCLSVM